MAANAEMLQLSLDKLKELHKESSADARVEIARTIAHDYASGAFNSNESLLAIEIIRILTRDAIVLVRKTLSQELLQSLDLPRDITLKIASDVPEVSVPFLEHSWALSEEDMIEITRATTELEKLSAIARRESVSLSLSGALLDKKIDGISMTLFNNRGALVSEDDLYTHFAQISGNDTLLEALVNRGGLSQKMAEKIFERAADHVKTHLAKTYGLSMRVAENISSSAGNLARMDITENISQAEIETLVKQLHSRGRLDFSLILKALCKGDLRFFEIAMARLANISVINARILMLDPGDMGLRSLYQAAGLPENFYDAIQRAIRVTLEETNYGRFTRRDLRLRVHARLQKEAFDHIENMDYLLGMIGASERESATVH